MGYWNADCLSVLISTDFDGKDVSKAKWTDITSSFDIPQEPSKGYGTLALAGTFNLTDYVGKNVPTSHSELIEVRLPEYDDDTGVYLMAQDQ